MDCQNVNLSGRLQHRAKHVNVILLVCSTISEARHSSALLIKKKVFKENKVSRSRGETANKTYGDPCSFAGAVLDHQVHAMEYESTSNCNPSLSLPRTGV